MPWTGSEGPPSLTAIHRWHPSGGGSLDLNNQVNNPPLLPFPRITQITGWRSLPESEDNRQPRTYGEGEITYPSRKLGKTVVYEGRVEAATVQTAEANISAVLGAFSDMSNEGRMEVIPYSSFGGSTWEYHARVLDLEVDPVWEWSAQRRDHFRLGFSLSLRMSNPYFYQGGVAYP